MQREAEELFRTPDDKKHERHIEDGNTFIFNLPFFVCGHRLIKDVKIPEGSHVYCVGPTNYKLRLSCDGFLVSIFVECISKGERCLPVQRSFDVADMMTDEQLADLIEDLLMDVSDLIHHRGPDKVRGIPQRETIKPE